MSATTAVTEFNLSEFGTHVTSEDENSVIRVIDESVEQLLEHIDTADFERILRSNKAKDRLKKADTGERKPEELTKQTIVEPLLEALGYDNYTKEVGGFAPNSKQEADYEFPLDDIDEISSNRLLLEAEPINKPLDAKGHGINQVKSWLRLKDFEADYGITTDGVKWVLIQRDPDSHAYNTIRQVDLQPVFLALFNNHITEREPPESALDPVDVERVSRFIEAFSRDNFIAIATDAKAVIKKKQEQITDEFYNKYVQHVFGVTKDGDPADRSVNSLIGGGIRAPSVADGDDTRLFAVNLMNRLVFIKFLEDKQIVHPDTLSTLKSTYKDGVYTETFYKQFIEKLFFDVFNTKPPRAPEIQNIELFNDVPYLNGGLFREELNAEKELSAREFDVNNEPLFQIIDFLEKYSFSVSGGPTDMDPSVLGNVFEKTVTYLTTDAGDKNAELGAYYTPKEITRFSAEQTIYPALRDRFCEYMVQEWGWTGDHAEQYETYRDVVDAIPRDQNVVEGLLNEVDELSVLDPAAGSGHFLKAALEEIRGVREELRLSINDEQPPYKLMKRTVQNNIYGVDIMEPALEIGKLRLWLNIVKELDEDEVDDFNSKELALPNVTFNLRVGNSLIGLNKMLERDDDDQWKLEKWMPESVGDRYNDVIEQVRLHEKYNHDPNKAEKHRREAERLMEEHKPELDSKIYDEFKEFTQGVSDDDLEEYAPFHWILEFAKVYNEGGFDVLIGNPPWDRLRPTRDEYFTQHEGEFSKLQPEEKNNRQQELLENDEIRSGWEEYQREVELVSDYFHESDTYDKQKPTVGGVTQGTENDLAPLFFERAFSLTQKGGYCSLVLPAVIFNGASAKDLRLHLLSETDVKSLVHFRNGDKFSGVSGNYRFGVLTFQNSNETNKLYGLFEQDDLNVLNSIEEEGVEIPRDVLENYSPEARIFPSLTDERDVQVLSKIIQHPPINDHSVQGWYAEPYAELHRTSDTDRFLENPDEGDYPVFGGSNIYQFSYDPSFVDIEPPEFWSVDEDKDSDLSAKRRIREKNFRKLKRALYDAFNGSGSQIGFVNDLLKDKRDRGLSEEDVLLDCSEYRIVFRDVARASDERTIIASVIPEGIVCTNTLHTLRPYEIKPAEEDLEDFPLHSAYKRIFSDESLFAALGLLNSIPFDYLMRTKVDTHIVMYKLKESQIPRLTEGEDWFEYIWQRAAQLNCYGEEFQKMRERLEDIEPATDPEEREEIQAELDAASFHAYGLDREQTKFILDDFHRIQNPRVMTEDYFNLVLKKYDELEREGPFP